MSRCKQALLVGSVVVFSLMSSQLVNGQSGSRNIGSAGSSGASAASGGGGSFGGSSSGAFGSRGRRNSAPVLSPEQQFEIRQQIVAQQRANAALQRQSVLTKFSANPNSRENRNQYGNAYKDAKVEFTAIRNGKIPVAGNKLQRPFLLRSNELNRSQRMIKWPKALHDEQHAQKIVQIEQFIGEMKMDSQELNGLIRELTLEVERRVVAKSISIKEYATAKRFLTGLSNETEL